MSFNSTADILIIGGGPAGLSAAATIVRQSHKTIIFDSCDYRNARTPYMHTLAGWDHRDPAEFRSAAKKDFERYGTVTVENAKVKIIRKIEDELFEVTTGEGKTATGRKVVLATGVEDVFPEIPGYAECWVTGIFHCLYCHGWEETGVESSGVLAQGDTAAVVPALHLGRQGLRISRSITIYTDGNEKLGQELTDALVAAPAPMTVETRKISKISKAPERAQVTVHFEDGTEKTEDFLAHKPKFRLKGDLAQQLGCQITPMSTIAVTPPFNQTTVKGVFAAGDCANPMQTLAQALCSGTAAGAGGPLQLQAEQFNQKAIF